MSQMRRRSGDAEYGAGSVLYRSEVCTINDNYVDDDGAFDGTRKSF